MKNNDNLFDEKIKSRLKMENSEIPEDINKKLDETINGLGKKKKNYKKVSGICAACLAGTILFGVTMPTYAQNIPVLGKIFEVFHDVRYENYDKYASDLNVTKESNGYKVTINKVVYDTIELEIFYTIESDKPLEAEIDLSDVKLEINNQWLNVGFGGNGKKVDDFTYVGSRSYSLSNEKSIPKEFKKNLLGGNLEIPDDFNLGIEISSLGKITDEFKVEGEWNFNIPISSKLVKENLKEQNLNIDLGNDFNGTTINNFIQTPINTVLQMVQTKDQNDNSHLDFVIFDDQGRYLQAKGSSGFGNNNAKGEHKTFFTYNFKEVYDDSKSLTIIPYIQRDDSKTVSNGEVTFLKELKAKLDLNKPTEVKLDNGEVYSKVKKIENIEGKTRVYYDSKYSIYGAPNYIINNETGEKIEPIGNKEDGYTESIKHVNENEFYIDFPIKLTDNDYSIVFLDRSNYEPIEKIINIELK